MESRELDMYFQEALASRDLTWLDEEILAKSRELASVPEPDFQMLFPSGLHDLELNSRFFDQRVGREQREQKKTGMISAISHAVLKELYLALCEGHRRYRDEVQSLAENSKVLIGAVAGYLAAETGVAVVVLSALTASVLMLISKAGLSAFCRFGARRYAEVEPDTASQDKSAPGG